MNARRDSRSARAMKIGKAARTARGRRTSSWRRSRHGQHAGGVHPHRRRPALARFRSSHTPATDRANIPATMSASGSPNGSRSAQASVLSRDCPKSNFWCQPSCSTRNQASISPVRNHRKAKNPSVPAAASTGATSALRSRRRRTASPPTQAQAATRHDRVGPGQPGQPAQDAGQEPAAAPQGQKAGAGQGDHQALGVDQREDDRPREEAEQEGRPAGSGRGGEPGGDPEDDEGRPRPGHQGDEEPGRAVGHAGDGADQPDRQREDREEGQGALHRPAGRLRDGLGIPVADQAQVPAAVPHGGQAAEGATRLE